MIALADPVRLSVDAAAVLLTAFGIYFPRHRRRDLTLAILSINVCVVAVAMVLARADVSAGLGVGLFGVLSIIRVRSIELDQVELAYYFSSIALGLLGGVRIHPGWMAPVLMGAVVATLYVIDHPTLFARYRIQMVTLDRALADEAEIRRRLEVLLGAEIVRLRVKRIDLVEDTTAVDVRYRLPAGASAER